MSFLLLLSNQVGQSYVVEHLWEDANRLLKNGLIKVGPKKGDPFGSVLGTRKNNKNKCSLLQYLRSLGIHTG